MVRFAKFAPVLGVWWVLSCWRGSYCGRFSPKVVRGKVPTFPSCQVPNRSPFLPKPVREIKVPTVATFPWWRRVTVDDFASMALQVLRLYSFAVFGEGSSESHEMILAHAKSCIKIRQGSMIQYIYVWKSKAFLNIMPDPLRSMAPVLGFINGQPFNPKTSLPPPQTPPASPPWANARPPQQPHTPPPRHTPPPSSSSRQAKPHPHYQPRNTP